MYSVIVKRIRGEENIFHNRMTRARIDIEHEFGLAANLWKRLNTKHSWHILSMINEFMDMLS